MSTLLRYAIAWPNSNPSWPAFGQATDITQRQASGSMHRIHISLGWDLATAGIALHLEVAVSGILFVEYSIATLLWTTGGTAY